jgi:hypothetical protein
MATTAGDRERLGREDTVPVADAAVALGTKGQGEEALDHRGRARRGTWRWLVARLTLLRGSRRLHSPTQS